MINFNLKKYITPVFIETGIGQAGLGIQKALDAGFEHIVSMDICQDLFDRACVKFKNHIELGRVRLLRGDSAQLLPEILKELDCHATFWLDAHIDGPDSAGLSKVKCPLFTELDAIKNHHIKNHVVMIDDRRLFKDNEIRDNVNGWGNEVTETELRQRLKAINPLYKIIYEDGYQPDDVLVAGTMCLICNKLLINGTFCDECYQKDKRAGIFE